MPEITLVFWAIKLLSTAMGESTSDYLVNTYNPYVVVIAGFIGFAVIMALQFKVRRYIPWVYWLNVVSVAVFGTMAADVTHVALGVPYLASTIGFLVVLAAIFIIWWRTERTLSIHSITTPRREFFYWATVLATFALGTATGDVVAYTAGLGYFSAGIVFLLLFLVPAVLYRFRTLSPIALFWFAYIMTRPLGASFADWTGKGHAVGALGWGDGPVGGVLAVGIILLVSYLTLKQRHSRA